MRRSGTNFLHDLLLLHPNCEAGLPAEDFLMAHADLLVKYAKSVCGKWNSGWRVKQRLDQPERVLTRHIGKGLVSFLSLNVEAVATSDNEKILAPSSPKRLVTKSPSVENLKDFFKVFPDAQLIVIIRDGRSVIESGLQSFHWDFEVMTHAWADAARTILEFTQQSPNTDGKYLIVRYEDIFQDTEKEMKKILSFLGLEEHQYNFKEAANLPVKGSSEELRKGKEHFHWKPMERTPDFSPLSRWSYWSQAKRKRFYWIAGKYLARFGYIQPAELQASGPWQIWNYVLDVKYALRPALVRARRLPPLRELGRAKRAFALLMLRLRRDVVHGVILAYLGSDWYM